VSEERGLEYVLRRGAIITRYVSVQRDGKCVL
jgi:hypothetical protein